MTDSRSPRMESLRERAEQRLYGLGVLNMDYPEHRLEAVDATLAAIGLDDLDAAVERLVVAMCRAMPTGMEYEPDDDDRDTAHFYLASLFATPERREHR